MFVNKTFARTLWSGEGPLGRIITPTLGPYQEYRVIGVVGGVRYFGFEKDSGPEVYFPIHQSANFRSADLVVRASGSPVLLAAAVRTALRSADPNLPAAEFRTMDERGSRGLRHVKIDGRTRSAMPFVCWSNFLGARLTPATNWAKLDGARAAIRYRVRRIFK